MIDMEIVLKSLNMEELSEKHRDVAEIIGLQNYILLCKNLGGSQLYIPTVESLTLNNIRKRIVKEKDILTYKELAKKYPISESTAYRIIKESR